MTTPPPRTFEDFFDATYASQYPQSGVPDGIREVALVTWEARERELERKGIAHLVNAAGRPVVTWAAVNARMGTERLAVRLGAQTLIRGQISAFSGAAR